MTVQCFPSGPFATNSYLFSCPTTKECVIIDAPPDCLASISSYIKGNHLLPKQLLLTHSHWDHIAEASSLRKEWHLSVAIHPDDRLNLEKPGADKLPCWIAIEGLSPDLLLQEGQIISVGNLKLQVIGTPGHTPGGVSFYCAEEKLLFSGDTLFQGTIGNLSFPTASPKLMWESLKKLSQLPDETTVFPGHGPSTAIGKEKWLARAEELFG